MRVEVELIDPDWAERIRSRGSATELLLHPDPQPLLIAHRALRSFLDAQWILASYLASIDPRTAIDRTQAIKTLLGIGRQHVLQGHVYGEESVSSELFGAALKAAANRDVLDPGREDVRAARVAWLEQIEEVISRLRTIDEMERELRKGVLAE
jgi:glycerol-3-phosphate O-acyltransferase